MITIISILRGINVSGKNKIPMVELKALYEKLGFKNVTTYIQSGNVVFTSRIADDKAIAEKIKKGIKTQFGFDVPVITRTLPEMQTIVETNPLLKEKGIDVEKLHVTFLSDNPTKENLEKIKDVNYPPDEFVLEGKEIYISCPNGYGNTKLSNNFFENKLKVTATTRNWRTVNELVRMGLI